MKKYLIYDNQLCATTCKIVQILKRERMLNIAETPQLTIPRVRRSSLSRSEYMKKVFRYYNGDDDWLYTCTDVYKKVKNAQAWELCPICGLIPKIWEFDNGRQTACRCGKNKYDHFKIMAESICSVMKHSHNGQSMVDYDSDALRKNWNHWAKTGEILWEHNYKVTGRW